MEENIKQSVTNIAEELVEEVTEENTSEGVSSVIDDKVESLENIKESISSPNQSNFIPDPWEGSYTVPKIKAKFKKTKKKEEQPKEETRKEKMNRAAGMVGSGILKAGKTFAKTALKPTAAAGSGGTASYGGGAGGGSTPSSAGSGPSLFGIGSWLSKKVINAFQDAKVEKARALEAQSNGAEIPAEMLEPGYFLKKSIGYQFGGRAFDTTFGAFIEKIPAKQSSKKAGFGDQFDYGENDPKKKKNKKDLPSELASGFRSVNKSLKSINTKLTENIRTLGDLVKETTRVGDILEQIMTGMGGMVDLELKSDIDQEVQQQNQQSLQGEDIVINIDGENASGLDLFDIVQGIDDLFDLTNRRKNRGLGNQNRRYRNQRRGTNPNPQMRRTSRTGGPKGRFGQLLNLGKLINFSEGGVPSKPVRALVGEAGPELVMRSGMQSAGSAPQATTKLAAGGVASGGMLPTTGVGYGGIKGGEAMGFAQPLADAMDVIMKVSGSQVLGTMGNFLRSVGPLAGVFSGMLMPFVNPLSTIFGINQTAAASELTQGVPTENEAIKSLGKIFKNIFKVLGIFGGGGGEDDDTDEEDPNQTATGDWAPLLDVIAAGEGSYTSVNPGQTIEGLTDMTIAEAWQAAKSLGESKGGTGAMGRYQLLSDPIGRARSAGLDPNKDKFSPANQDKIASYIIENYRRGNDWKQGKITDEQFGTELAKEWAGVQMPSGRGYYDGDGQNNAKVKWEKVKEAMQKMKGRGAYRGMVKSFSSNFGKMEGMFEISGPDTGYKVPENLTHGQKIIGHGVEWLMKFNRSFVILPVENRQYSVTKDPKKTLTRWSELSRQANIETDGVDWDPIKIYKPSTKPMSTGETMTDVFSMFSKPVDVKPQKEMPTATVTPINFDAGTRPSGVAILNNTLVHTQQVPVYIPVPVPGPTEYVAANIYESARTMRFMEFVKKLS